MSGPGVSMKAATLCVPAPFARALLDDLREPADDPERKDITDPEQLASEAEMDAAVRAWEMELDGEGARRLIVASGGPSRAWLADYLVGAMFEGLISRLRDGSAADREDMIEALAGWADVMAQLDRSGSET